MINLFLDSAVILDFFYLREPFCHDIKNLFKASVDKEWGLYTSSLVCANVHYFLAKQKSKTDALDDISKLTSFVTILSVTGNAVTLALQSGMPDFEDAIQFFAAIEGRMTTIITRNKRDYKNKILPVMDAKQFLEFMKVKAS